jgi:hypothetical protein
MSWVNNIETHFVDSYHANVEMAFQQSRSRLEDTVVVGTQNSEFDYWDRIGAVEANEIEGRGTDTPLNTTPVDRRRLQTRGYDWADLIDRQDKLRLLADPSSSYVQNAVAALNRKKDRVIITAFKATAYAGKSGETAVAWPSANTVDVDYVETGSTTDSNLTIGKLRRVLELMMTAEVIDEDGIGDGTEPQVTAVITANQVTALLRTTEVTSGDYNTVKALAEGKVNTFMGFKFKRTQLLPKSGNVRSCFFYVKRAVRFNKADEINTDVGPRRDKRNSVQVYARADFGAVRMWEEGIYEVLCDETK